MLIDGLYHTDVYLPFQLNLKGVLRPYYTAHARQAAASDRYGTIILRDTLNLDSLKIVEVEIRAGRAVKIVGRMPYNNWLDITIVITAAGIVKTVWLNKKSDTHRTLDCSKYIQAPSIGNQSIKQAS